MNKKIFCCFMASTVLFLLVIFALNIKVTTRQGVDYKVSSIRIPLYLKTLDFFDRHINYIQLAKRITAGAKNGEEKALKILEWTHANLRKVPEGFPVVDDHAWNIIVRGYAVEDQYADVFATLCNYAGLESYFTWLYGSAPGEGPRIAASFVNIDGKWFVFDPYRSVYFKDSQGKMADVKAIRSGCRWVAQSDAGSASIKYDSFFKNMDDAGVSKLQRANIQSPLRRFLFEVKKWLRLN